MRNLMTDPAALALASYLMPMLENALGGADVSEKTLAYSERASIGLDFDGTARLGLTSRGVLRLVSRESCFPYPGDRVTARGVRVEDLPAEMAGHLAALQGEPMTPVPEIPEEPLIPFRVGHKRELYTASGRNAQEAALSTAREVFKPTEREHLTVTQLSGRTFAVRCYIAAQVRESGLFYVDPV